MPDKRDYARKLDEITRRYRNLESGTIDRLIQMLYELRNEINGQITDAGGFEEYRLRALRQNITRLITEFESRAASEMVSATGSAHEMGGKSVTEPIQALGYTNTFYQPSTAQVNILADFTADLIRNITAAMRAQIDRQIFAAGLGQQSPFDTMRAITKILGLQGRTKYDGGVAYRAEMITRTELQRTFNLATDSQMQASVQQIPGLLKRWIHSGKTVTARIDHIRVHLQTLEDPIPVGQMFNVGGELMRHPLDPNASAKNVINCGCRMVTIIPEVGVIRGSIDARTEKQYEQFQEKTPTGEASQGLSRSPADQLRSA